MDAFEEYAAAVGSAEVEAEAEGMTMTTTDNRLI